MSEDGAGSSRLAGTAREAIRHTAAPPAGAGPLRRLLRRTVLRLLRPYTAQQRLIDERILDAIDELERRAGERDQLELDLLVEDIVSSLDNLRSRVAAGEDLVAGSRALPYTAGGVLEHFSAPVGGMVIGYRRGPDRHESAYVSFEEVFRGSEERVRERQEVYLGLLAGQEPVLDAGCGRGELLDLLRDRGVAALGVDLDEGMVERSRAKGHEVELGEANRYLERLSDGELGAVFSAQVIEHLPYKELMRFLELSHAKLRPGGVFVAETVNPHAPHALKTFWVDPTHQHPVFPEVAIILCRAAGFESAYAFHPLGTGDVDADRYVESEYAVVARKA
jgi:SAM-dependent methyltransferase